MDLRLIKALSLAATLLVAAAASAQDLVGEFEAAEGEVTLRPSAEPGSILEASLGDKVAMEDVVTTLARSRARLRFLDASTVSLGENTRLRITRMVFDPTKAREVEVRLDSGVALFQVTRAATTVLGQIFQVITPFATIRVKGTAFVVEVREGRTIITVTEGSVEVEGPAGGTVLVPAGEHTEIDVTGRPAPSAPTPPGTEGKLLGGVISASAAAPALTDLDALGVVGRALGLGLDPALDLLSSSPLGKVAPSLLGQDGFLNQTLGQASLGGIVGGIGIGSILTPDDAAGLTRITGQVVVIP